MVESFLYMFSLHVCKHSGRLCCLLEWSPLLGGFGGQIWNVVQDKTGGGRLAVKAAESQILSTLNNSEENVSSLAKFDCKY